MIEPAAKQRALLELRDQRGNAFTVARQRAVNALVRQQHTALQSKANANRAQRLAQLAKIGQRGELIEGGNLVGHGECLSGAEIGGNPAFPAIAQLGKNMSCNTASDGSKRSKNKTSEQSGNEEFPFRRPVDGPRPERDGGDVASSCRADGGRRAAGRWHGGGRSRRRLRAARRH